MTSLNDIVDATMSNKEKKVKLKDCRVFYVNVRGVAMNKIPKMVSNFISIMSQRYDVSGVIFVPTDAKESGWQFP